MGNSPAEVIVIVDEFAEELFADLLVVVGLFV